MEHQKPSFDRIVGMKGPRLTGFVTSQLARGAEAARISASASELIMSRGSGKPCLFRVPPTPGPCS